ncbi:MAG: hypothetical protein ACRCVW_01165 [Brevinema sp.]
MPHSNITQSNIFGNNNINIIPQPNQRDQLGRTIDKIFEIISDRPYTPVGKSVAIEQKIKHNELSNKWIEKINYVIMLSQDIETLCSSDSSLYQAPVLINYFRIIYQDHFQENLKNEATNANNVLEDMVEHVIKVFNNTVSIQSESHDRLTLPYLVIYSFINCGVLEKP